MKTKFLSHLWNVTSLLRELKALQTRSEAVEKKVMMMMNGVVVEVDNDMDQVEVEVDQVEREKVHLELVDKQRRAESHTQCREDRAGQG